jgi:ribosomal protein S18 acetylase RimI-like enzyme
MHRRDLAAVLALDAAAVAHNHRLVPLVSAPDVDRWSARRFWAGAGRRRDSIVLVAAEGQSLLGMLCIDVNDARNRRMKIRRWVYLHSLYVDRRARGRRVAQRLIRHALAWARRHGAGGATLEMAANNDAARALYGRFGFATQEVMMARRLPQSGR